jgi:hypothetical protein
MGSYTFDLLDVGTQAVGANTKFMDNMAKAYFWHLVASFLQGARSPLGVPRTPPPLKPLLLLSPLHYQKWLG